jgi:hypothetical protein
MVDYQRMMNAQQHQHFMSNDAELFAELTWTNMYGLESRINVKIS